MRRGESALGSLPAWRALNDVKFFDVKVENIGGKGHGLITERDLASGQGDTDTMKLITIPKELVLSARAVEEYAKADKTFRALFEAAGHQTCRIDILLFLLMQLINSSPDFTGSERILSPWTQYFTLLPDTVLVPTMWTGAEIAYLRGTSLEWAVSAKLAALTKEFGTIRAKSNDLSFWDKLICVDELVTDHDWVLLDALYRSRSLGLPISGESMVPCIDFANHSRKPTAYFEEDSKDEVSLLLRRGCSIPAGQEITIDYGQEKSAAEMLFNYGFIDPDASANSLVLPLDLMEDDPLMKAKLHAFGGPPTVRFEDNVHRIPRWESPFVYLMCLNEEDGLHLRLLQETDGSQHLAVYWQEEDVTNQMDTFKTLISSHELCYVFELRAVTLLHQQLRNQLIVLQAPVDASKMPGIVRPEVLHNAMRLRELELDLLGRAARVLDEQKSSLLEEDSVQTYLEALESNQSDQMPAESPNGVDDDFS